MLRSNKRDAHHGSKEKQPIQEKKARTAQTNFQKCWIDIGPDVTSKIIGYLSPKAVTCLAQTGWFFSHSAKTILTQHKLAHHIVVEPNEDKVTAILKCEPTLVK